MMTRQQDWKRTALRAAQKAYNRSTFPVRRNTLVIQFILPTSRCHINTGLMSNALAFLELPAPKSTGPILLMENCWRFSVRVSLPRPLLVSVFHTSSVGPGSHGQGELLLPRSRCTSWPGTLQDEYFLPRPLRSTIPRYHWKLKLILYSNRLTEDMDTESESKYDEKLKGRGPIKLDGDHRRTVGYNSRMNNSPPAKYSFCKLPEFSCHDPHSN